MKSAPRTVVWAILILLAFIFVMQGLSKFAGQPSTRWAARFAYWGYPAALRYVVGAIEILGGIGLLVPKATRAAAGALILLMAGAFYTHVSHRELGHVAPPLVLGTLAFLIFLYRHPHAHKRSS